MQYAFVLGRVYTLSLAELFSYFERLNLEVSIIDASPEILIIETAAQLDVHKMQKELGGTVKILRVIDSVKKRELDSINFALKHYFKPSKIKNDFLKNAKGKIQFGVSVYLLDGSLRPFGEPKRLGMFIKRAMQDSGASIRLVIPEFNSLALASVVVTKNLLLEKGAEICAIASVDKVYVAKTIVVQDFEDYGRRDYQRPIRDEKQGMIPPKVAQMMLNFANAKPGDTLYDPLCGIGTTIQEGVLLGYKMLGSDINPHAVTGSETNLEWFRNRYKIPKGKYHVEAADAKHSSALVENLVKIGAFKEIAGIVTEGYLGPMYTSYPKESEIKANFDELKALYTASFKDFFKFLPSKGKVVICLPAYKKRDGYEHIENLDFITDIGYNLKDLISPTLAGSMPFLKLTDRGTAIYDRKDQVVAREILVFEKN